MAGKASTESTTPTDDVVTGTEGTVVTPTDATTEADVQPGDTFETLDGTERAGTLVELAEQVEPEAVPTTEVQLVHHWTTADGQAVAPGSIIDVPVDVADQLLSAGYAQTPGAGESQGTEPTE